MLSASRQRDDSPWDCGDGVLLLYEGSSPSVNAAIDAAASRWNAAFASERGGGVPRFRRISTAVPASDTAGQRKTVRVRLNGSGEAWCDATNVTGANKAINLYPDGSPQCDGNTGSLDAILLHALGHALGLSSFPMHRQGVVGVSDHCAIFLPAAGEPNAGGVNNQLCQHEIDVVLMIYGAYPADLPADRFAFWGKHILSRTGLPDSVRLREDETRVLSPVGPYFAYAQNPPAVNGPGLTWVTSNAEVAVVKAGNVLDPGLPGYAELHAMVRSTGLPASVRRSVRLREGSTGHRIAVNVTPAVWQPGYRVTDIIGPSAPLEGGQTYHFTTTVVNGGDPDSLRVTWRVTRSFAPGDTQVVADTPNQLDLDVAEGSYSLRVIATPRDLVSDSTGGAFVRDYPVCTEQVLPYAASSTNMPQGCGQPPVE